MLPLWMAVLSQVTDGVMIRIESNRWHEQGQQPRPTNQTIRHQYTLFCYLSCSDEGTCHILVELFNGTTADIVIV